MVRPLIEKRDWLFMEDSRENEHTMTGLFIRPAWPRRLVQRTTRSNAMQNPCHSFTAAIKERERIG